MFCRRFQKAKADNGDSEGDELEPADAGLPQVQPPYSQDRIGFRRDVSGQCSTNLEADHRPTSSPAPDDRGEQNGMCPAVPPQVAESGARTPTLPDDESTDELEPADAEPRLQSQSPSGAASSRAVHPQQRSGLSQHPDHRSDGDQASDPEHRHPSVQDDRREQNEESRASMPRSPVDEGSNPPELAHAEPSMQPPASHVGVKRQRVLGRLRRYSTDDGEDYYPSVCSDTEHSDDDAVRPPRRKRRRASAATHTAGGTTSQQQTRPYRSDSSREARRPSRPETETSPQQGM